MESDDDNLKFKTYFKIPWKIKQKELQKQSIYGSLKSYKVRQIIIKVDNLYISYCFRLMMI